MLQGIIPVSISANLIKKAHQPTFISGRLLANQMLGQDNEGLITRREYLQYFSTLAIETDKILIADAQSGFGNEISAWTTADELGSAGAKYIIVNDQSWPSLSNRVLKTVFEQDLINRIRACMEGSKDYGIEIIPKLEGVSRYGYEGLVYRIQLLLELGLSQIVVSRLDKEILSCLTQEPFFDELGIELDDKKISVEESKRLNPKFIIPTFQTINKFNEIEAQILDI